MKSKIDAVRSIIVRENIVSHVIVLTRTAACVISDIVKRRSIRVWGLRSNSRHRIHYLRDNERFGIARWPGVRGVLVGEA